MNQEFEPTPEETVALFKALSDPNRLNILDILMQGDSCNCELNERLGLPPNLLSHHLRVLRETGLINSRRDVVDGRWIYYSIDKDTIIQWRAWLMAFLDPARIQDRVVLCGPQGQQIGTEPLLEAFQA
jgi:ArsR family transcriptional regulator